MVRPCDNAKKGSWAAEEKESPNFGYISKHGSANWTSFSRKTGQRRCGKNCKSRWNNNSYEGFTEQEDELIIKLHAAVGSRWGLIAHQLPGRTENDIKIHWNTKLKKKLTEMGIDPITHKPFSQILSDYGNIGGLSRSSHTPKYIGTIQKDLKKTNTFTLPKPNSSSTSSHSSYTFLSNSQHNYPNQFSNNTHSLNLLSQLQAITLVTEGPISGTNNLSPNYTNCDPFEVLSPKSSAISSTTSASVCSSEYANTAGQTVKSPECFSWHDYLLEDEVKPAQNHEVEHEWNNLTDFMKISEGNDGGFSSRNDIQGTNVPPRIESSDGSSFLEAMLDQENDMFLSFPGLMEEPLY